MRVDWTGVPIEHRGVGGRYTLAFSSPLTLALSTKSRHWLGECYCRDAIFVDFTFLWWALHSRELCKGVVRVL
jgi:hypothetical protein